MGTPLCSAPGGVSEVGRVWVEASLISSTAYAACHGHDLCLAAWIVSWDVSAVHRQGLLGSVFQ